MHRQRLRAWSAAFLVIVVAGACVPGVLPLSGRDDGTTDHQYVAIALGTEEVVAFLAQYPGAERLVDREGTLAVDFRAGKPPVTTNQTWKGIRLRVWLDPASKRPTRTQLQCDNRFVSDGIIEFLERHAITKSCVDVSSEKARERFIGIVDGSRSAQ